MGDDGEQRSRSENFAKLAAEMESLPNTLLTKRMWDATKEVHKKSDGVTRIKATVALTDRKLWGQTVGWFYQVISQIETSLERSRGKHHAIPKVLGSFDAMRRSESFESDLVTHLGSGWRDKITTPPAVAAYVNHIKSLEESDPLMLACYYFHFQGAFTGGGPILQRMVTTSLRLKKGGGGTRLFDYEGGRGKALFQDLKRIFNELGLTEEEEDRLVKEGVSVFERNDTIVDCVTGSVGWGSMFRSFASPPVQICMVLFAAAVGLITRAIYY